VYLHSELVSVEQQTNKLLNIDEELDKRIQFAYHLLPDPNDPEEPVTVADVKSPVNAAGANSAAGKIAVGNIRKKLKTLSFGGDR
jgi:type IV secretion system protein VirD4